MCHHILLHRDLVINDLQQLLIFIHIVKLKRQDKMLIYWIGSLMPNQFTKIDNKVLKKLNQLGKEVKGLDKYLERKTLINKKEAEKYIDKLLSEKNKK